MPQYKSHLLNGTLHDQMFCSEPRDHNKATLPELQKLTPKHQGGKLNFSVTTGDKGPYFSTPENDKVADIVVNV
jgi:hypothetical protein